MKFFRKKAVWLPTVPSLILLLLLLGILAASLFFKVYPFLAESRPLPQAQLVIVEGWMADAELIVVANSIRPGQLVVTSGGPITFAQKILHYENYAELGTARLIEMGIPKERILIAPAPDTDRDRTFISAKAVRRKLEEEGLFGQSAQLYTVGAHARRSHLLYQRVFGRDYPLGVVSVAPAHYNLEHWYLYSAGIRHVTGELIAWIYAKFLMLPFGAG